MVPDKKEYLNNISLGGLSFKSNVRVAAGTLIHIKVPLARPVFSATAKVVWCRKNGTLFDVGAEFTGKKDTFKIRMVEQICYIESYKKKILKKKNRKMTGEQAALEWIARFAHSFPKEK
ncbi:MAG: PilZ domain-containing protein [Endomicrobiales bacterium]